MAERRSLKSLPFGVIPAAVAVIVLGLYVLFATGGAMTVISPTSEVYAQLGESFARGRLDLLLDPPPRLASIDNPYDPEQRRGIEVSTDASYYRGRYYVYWGPAPAALEVLWRILIQRRLGDAGIAFLAEAVVFLASTSIIYRLWRRTFSNNPIWLFAVVLAAVGLAHPALWNLKYPAVYEAAIGSGQAFLLAGLALAEPAITGDEVSGWRMALVGALWGLAVASRLTLAPAVVVLVVGALTRFGSSTDGRHPVWTRTAAIGALLLPIVLGLGCLALYNYLRFGRATESGFQYQLVPDFDYTRLIDAGHVFSPLYFLPNALNYAVGPIAPDGTFPFVSAVSGPWLDGLDLPAYTAEPVAGIAIAAPLAVFAVLPIGILAARKLRSVETTTSRADNALRLGGVLFVAALASSIPTVAYRHSANRFELDYVPLLMIAAVIGVWTWYGTRRDRKAAAVILVAAMWTVLMGIVLGAGRI